jgi:peroxiredoxin
MIASRLRDGVLILAVLLLIALAHHLFRPHLRPVHAGEALGSFEVTRLDGSAAALAPRAGHPLLLVVFATWCPSCRSELPALRAIVPQLIRGGVDVVGVDQAESTSEVQRFAQAYALPYPVYVDGSGATKQYLGARIIPTTVATDRNGIVRILHSGPLDRPELLSLAQSVSR